MKTSNLNKIKTGLLFLLILGLGTLNAQSLKVNPKASTMTIYGTTNVHDFETNVTQISGEAVMSGSKLQSMYISIPVKSIKSKEKLMDTKTYDAFNADKYATITFKMTEVNSLQINGSDVNATVTGNLTMAGVTKRVVVKATGKNTRNGVYLFKGSIALKMSDFNMKAPTAMMGMMKVGDVVTLKFNVSFEGAQL